MSRWAEVRRFRTRIMNVASSAAANAPPAPLRADRSLGVLIRCQTLQGLQDSRSGHEASCDHERSTPTEADNRRGRENRRGSARYPSGRCAAAPIGPAKNEAKMITAKATTLQRRVNGIRLHGQCDSLECPRCLLGMFILFNTIAYRRHARCRLPWLLCPLCHAGGMDWTWRVAVEPVRSEVYGARMSPSPCFYRSWWWWRSSGVSRDMALSFVEAQGA